MKNLTLAQSYLVKAKARLKILRVLYDEKAYSDAVREAQEIVELALKGMLRQGHALKAMNDAELVVRAAESCTPRADVP